jgi:hypothetical protein
VSSLLYRGEGGQTALSTIHAGDEVGSGGWDPAGKPILRPASSDRSFGSVVCSHRQPRRKQPFLYKYASYPPSLPYDPESESFYSFTYGNVFFVKIDTNKAWFDIVIDPENPHETPISKWLKGAIEIA